MKCPQCNKELKIPSFVYGNVEAYDNAVVKVTECCEKPVRVSRVTSFSVSAYSGEMEYDDWGTKISKQNPQND